MAPSGGRLSLRARLFLLVAVALIPALAILAYNEVALRRSRAAEAHALAQRYGELAALEIDGIVRGVESLLVAIARTPAARRFEIDACAAYLAEVHAETPNLAAISVIDAEGTIRCRSPAAPLTTVVADRQYFREAFGAARFVVGSYTVSRVSGRGGLPLAAPIREGGAVVGVVAAALDLDWLGDRLRTREFAAGGALTVADRDGVILAREPSSARYVGARMPANLMRLVRAQAPGTEEIDGPDGIRRVVGYVPPAAHALGLYVSAGVSLDETYRALDAATRRGVALALAGAVSALLFAGLLGRRMIAAPVARIVAALEARRAEDRAARTGMSARYGEIEAVGAAVDRLMDELDVREERQRLLVDELNHRVKNALATVQSIALQSLRPGEDVEAAREAFVARLMALSRTHDMLTREDWAGAELGAILREAVAPYLDADPGRLDARGPRALLPPRAALSLSLALHELCTNAAKYGALSTPGGRVEARWSIEGEGGERALAFSWTERGGPAVTPPTRRGFGARLLEASVERELGGRVEVAYEPEGLVLRFVAPLPERAASPAPAQA